MGEVAPPFEDGNTAAVTHGGHSERVVAPVRDAERAVVAGAAPWLDRDEFTLAVEALSDVRARASVVGDWLQDNGLLDGKGKPRSGAVGLYLKCRRLELDLLKEMGLTPKSYASLAATWGTAQREHDLAAQRAEGRKLREAHE